MLASWSRQVVFITPIWCNDQIDKVPPMMNKLAMLRHFGILSSTCTGANLLAGSYWKS